MDAERTAHVPIGLSYLDYATRTAGFRGFLMPTGDVRKDMDAVRAAYAGLHGLHREKESTPRLREEDEVPLDLHVPVPAEAAQRPSSTSSRAPPSRW